MTKHKKLKIALELIEMYQMEIRNCKDIQQGFCEGEIFKDKLEEVNLNDNKLGWLGTYLDEIYEPLLKDVSNELRWHIGQTISFCISLLQDVNAHDEAAIVNQVLTPVFEKQDSEYINKVSKLLDLI